MLLKQQQPLKKEDLTDVLLSFENTGDDFRPSLSFCSQHFSVSTPLFPLPVLFLLILLRKSIYSQTRCTAAHHECKHHPEMRIETRVWNLVLKQTVCESVRFVHKKQTKKTPVVITWLCKTGWYLLNLKRRDIFLEICSLEWKIINSLRSKTSGVYHLSKFPSACRWN